MTSEDIYQETNLLPLPSSRHLHYAHTGNTNSSTVAIFFVGYFSVGTASPSSLPKVFQDAHWIAPTLPGNGLSSSTPQGVPYHINLCKSITALLEFLHPSDNSKGNAIEHLWIGGGSYGSVPCQILYGAPYSLFPFGRQIKGMLLTAPFSPFRYHAEYTRDMAWMNWMSVGPPSQWMPFRLVPRMLKVVIGMRMRDLEGARGVMDMALFSKMDAAELERFDIFAREERGISGEELKDQMAEGALRCVRNWDGFLEGPDVLHSHWGFEIGKLAEEHRKPVLVVLSEGDELGVGMGEWLVEQYGNARMKRVAGGHIAALYCMEEIWRELVEMSSRVGG